MMHNADLIASRHELTFSAIGAPLRSLYRSGRIPFGIVFDYLKYDYALTVRRFYGDSMIETVCIYDTIDPDIVLGLALSDAGNKILFVSERMADELAAGNRYLKDAVRTAAHYCNIAVVSTENCRKTLESLMKKSDRGKVRFAETPKDFLKIL